MLLAQKAYVEGALALVLRCATAGAPSGLEPADRSDGRADRHAVEIEVESTGRQRLTDAKAGAEEEPHEAGSSAVRAIFCSRSKAGSSDEPSSRARKSRRSSAVSPRGRLARRPVGCSMRSSSRTGLPAMASLSTTIWRQL